jgi:histidinol-phosphate aminotransferase
LTVRPRTALDGLAPYSAGHGVDEVRRRLNLKGPIVKLASNEGAYGPFESARKAIAAALDQANRYPPSGFGDLRLKLAEKHDIAPERVLIGAGLCAIIHHLAVAFLEPGDEVAYCSPAFTAYRLEAIKMGAKPVAAALTVDGACDLDALASAMSSRTKLAYVASPNNPTGNIVTRRNLEKFLGTIPDGVLVVVDEAYSDYVEDPDYPDAIREFAKDNASLVVMRTFSKIYGLAGLRIGYAICPAEVVTACAKVQNAFEVNRLALAAASASLGATDELNARRVDNRVNRSRLIDGLQAVDFEPLPSHGNFVRVEVGDGAAVASALERLGVIVRPLASMGDPTAIRVTVGTADEVDTFIAAFRQYLQSASSTDGNT